MDVAEDKHPLRMATWFLAPAEAFVRMRRRGGARGVRIRDRFGGTAAGLAGQPLRL